MKFLIAIALIATSLTATAARRTKINTSITTLAMNGVVTYDKLCLNNNNELQTINPRKVCVKYKRVRRGGEWERVCAQSEMQILTKAVNYEKKVCVRYRRNSDRDRVCTKFEMVDAVRPTSYTVTKTKHFWKGSRSDGDWSFPGKVISKTYHEVPACN